MAGIKAGKASKQTEATDSVVPKYATFAKNLNAALDAAGYPDLHYGRQVEVGKAFGISTSAARKWVMGDCLPDHENLILIADKLNIGLDALFGRAPRLSSEPMVSIPVGAAHAFSPGSKNDGPWLDYLSTIQMEASWLETGMRLKHDDLSLMMVTGDNMSPTLSEGDVVFVDAAPDLDIMDVEDNGIYLLMAQGKPQLRRILLGLDDSVTLTSDNKHFPPITVPLIAFRRSNKTGAPKLSIIGRVPWCVHRVSRAAIHRSPLRIPS